MVRVIAPPSSPRKRKTTKRMTDYLRTRQLLQVRKMFRDAAANILEEETIEAFGRIQINKTNYQKKQDNLLKEACIWCYDACLPLEQNVEIGCRCQSSYFKHSIPFTNTDEEETVEEER